MFFYLYAIIELLAIFLDSNVIPTANVSYPVSEGNMFSDELGTHVASVVRGCIYRTGRRGILLHTHQWICRIPVR